VKLRQQPHTYRIRLYRGDASYERLSNKEYVAVLDFSPGPMLRATEGQLDALILALPYAEGVRGRETLQYFLGVHDPVTNELQCHWPAKTWLED
jgi:hypothetical protein